VKYKHLKKELKEWKEQKEKLMWVMEKEDIEAILDFIVDKHIEVIESIINSPEEG